mmetsp:Transcript_31103/g.92605  ORF Transcript_31103/g.92605 Transcript_31103/m.92605 type:complete len:250 (+) Transcript_31103:803-1552(+)
MGAVPAVGGGTGGEGRRRGAAAGRRHDWRWRQGRVADGAAALQLRRSPRGQGRNAGGHCRGGGRARKVGWPGGRAVFGRRGRGNCGAARARARVPRCAAHATGRRWWWQRRRGNDRGGGGGLGFVARGAVLRAGRRQLQRRGGGVACGGGGQVRVRVRIQQCLGGRLRKPAAPRSGGGRADGVLPAAGAGDPDGGGALRENLHRTARLCVCVLLEESDPGAAVKVLHLLPCNCAQLGRRRRPCVACCVL